MDTEEREHVIVRTSAIGIVTNIGLAAMKAFIGLVTNSVAVTLDAVNNFTDALSSVVTIVGTKLSMRPPSKKHPFGFGRIEYLTALVVSIIVLYAGVTALLESGGQILEPQESEYSTLTLILIAVAVIVKIILGRYTIAMGRKTDSGALKASGADALFDAVLSASVLASALIMVFTDISLEAYVGVLISLFIIKAGFQMMAETLADILGQRSDPEITTKIKEIVTSEPGVLGAYDLVITDYGPGRYYASVHAEVDSAMTAEEIDNISRRLQYRVYTETGVTLAAMGIYSVNQSDSAVMGIRDAVMAIGDSHEWVLEVHGFHADTEAKEIRFDMVLSFGIDRDEALKTVHDEVAERYPDYRIIIAPDVDISD